MSREILFRGKRKDNQDWVEGSLVISDERYFIGVAPECITSLYYPDDIYAFTSFVEVISQIVGQYTGLIDKNGVKIFEGDIVKDSYGTLFTVVWDDINARFIGRVVSMRNKDKIVYVGREPAVEIIGNIYDTPEILEQSNER